MRRRMFLPRIISRACTLTLETQLYIKGHENQLPKQFPSRKLETIIKISTTVPTAALMLSG